jgi:hypothetical protein
MGEAAAETDASLPSWGTSPAEYAEVAEGGNESGTQENRKGNGRGARRRLGGQGHLSAFSLSSQLKGEA